MAKVAMDDSVKRFSASCRSLCVNGLTNNTRVSDFKALFSKYGKVSSAKIVHKKTRYYGIITMTTGDEALVCIENLNQTEFHGQIITVEKTTREPSLSIKQADLKSIQGKAPQKKSESSKDYPMAFPDSTWTRAGVLTSMPISKEKVAFMWDTFHYVKGKGCYPIEMKSDDFSFAGAIWNFFASFDKINAHSQFGINVKRHSSEKFDCYCDIVFKGECYEIIKAIECKFKCESARSHWTVTDFLTSSELNEVLDNTEIYCIINVKNIEDAYSQTEITLSRRSSCVESHTQTQLLENKDEDIPKSHPVYKVGQDLKQLLMSEEDSDVTFQVGDQQFKAHRSILKARSSVFAAMFCHNMKEKATGVVDAEDCEPSSFPVLLEFLYCGSTEKLSVGNVFSLYTSADKYDIQDLKIKCLEFIKNNLSVETFCETVKLGLQHSETNLLNLTIEFFAGNFKKIILTVKWQAFIVENPIIVNEILIKALASDVQND